MDGELPHRVVSRFLEATRPIWLDKREIANFVESQLVPQIESWLKHHPHPDEPIGTVEGLAHAKLDLEPANKRGVITVDVQVNARATKGTYAAVLGGRGGKDRIVLEINGALSPSDYVVTEFSLAKPTRLQSLSQCKHETCLPYGLYSILIHEATHVAEKEFAKELSYSPKDVLEQGEAAWGPYVNDPMEVRAFMQQIVDEVLHNVKHEGIREHAQKAPNANRKLVDLGLMMSTTWTLIEKHLTPKNKALILKAVYDRMDQARLLFDEGTSRKATQMECQSCGTTTGYDRTYMRCSDCGEPWAVGSSGGHFRTGDPPPPKFFDDLRERRRRR